MGGELVLVEDAWGQAVDPGKLNDALVAHPDAKIVAFVHAETSTGVCSDVEQLCALAAAAGCLTIVDAVTALGGIPLKVDEWGADVVYSGTQKCLSCPPGISLITFSDRAADVIKSRNRPVQSWFLDVSLLMDYWDGEGGRTYHHTAPVNAMYGLHEALLMLHEEGLETAWARHTTMHEELVAGLEPLGLEFVVPANIRLPQLNLVSVPEGVEEAQVRGELLNRYNLEIGAGLGAFAGKVWRIGLMGYAARREDVLLCTQGLSAILA